ncbi:hypothetical protein A4R35_04140 [Thermogemmatispora tikiterensis]|uniref:Secreted protein n=1 Tax=Thermogemmatispora tikiterensis TaxID=1825093 RepID=A0A328VGG3_9CHLR|nr:hypothetical protein A4R35_04140 [Thermogemmatispora tikiterensis]
MYCRTVVLLSKLAGELSCLAAAPAYIAWSPVLSAPARRVLLSAGCQTAGRPAVWLNHSAGHPAYHQGG